eukprot:TRINITY_DN7649_c0_g1_i2.p1 TRINITY_DN7649_c0_g1~~TRINITY_DN7649_c0_g1_i2.p1  ORF type:complete len:541 (+),score=143.03 TRINITY_DN7649_c0_g1_i2:114-1736(+)
MAHKKHTAEDEDGEKEPSGSYLPLLEARSRADSGITGSVTNPFVNRTLPAGPLRRAKNTFVAAVVFPLRLALMACTLSVAVGLCKVATLGLTKEDYDIVEGKPLAWWRTAIVSLIGPMARIQLFCLGFVSIKVKGKCAPKKEASIIVANHVSGLVEGVYFWQHAKLAETAYLQNPILKAIMLATQGVLVDRADPDSRHKARDALMRRSSEDGWPQTVVFPEGACTNGTAVVQFKLGAFTPGKPVQPVVFRYPFAKYDPSFTLPHGSFSYMGGLMKQLVNYMEVEYLPVYRPSKEEIENPLLFATGVQRVIADALGVPTTKHAAEDVALCMAAEQLHLPINTGLVQWQALSEKLVGVKCKDAKAVLAEFAAFDTSRRGRLDVDEFAAALRTYTGAAEGKEEALELTDDQLHNIFKLLDTKGDGYIDFTEYFCGVAVLNGYGSEEHIATLKLVFDGLADGQSKFSKAQLSDTLLRSIPTLSPARLDELCLEAHGDADGFSNRDDFIAFAEKHKEDLDLRASVLLGGSPMALPEKTLPEKKHV